MLDSLPTIKPRAVVVPQISKSVVGVCVAIPILLAVSWKILELVMEEPEVAYDRYPIVKAVVVERAVVVDT